MVVRKSKNTAVDYLKGSKIYSNEKNIEIFELIEKEVRLLEENYTNTLTD